MENTGERHILTEKITDKGEFYNNIMHLATYEYASDYVNGKDVLDYGCGSGYGAKILSKTANSVTAVDISDEAVEFAQLHYNVENVSFNKISSLTDKKFDVITSFQVIEHVPNAIDFIAFLKSKLKQNGVLLISTPDKKYRLFNHIQKPWNIYHLKEYNSSSLNRLLSNYFNNVIVFEIGSRHEFINEEIKRTKKQKLLTLPFTLVFYPKRLRIFLLGFLTSIYRFLKGHNNSIAKEVSFEEDDFKMQLSTKDIEFKINLELSTDLLAICQMN